MLGVATGGELEQPNPKAAIKNSNIQVSVMEGIYTDVTARTLNGVTT